MDTNRLAEDIPELIAGYNVRRKIDHPGPIVWTDVRRRPGNFVAALVVLISRTHFHYGQSIIKDTHMNVTLL